MWVDADFRRGDSVCHDGGIIQLLDICATFLAWRADCECGFSLMNSIKVKSRNRLEELR